MWLFSYVILLYFAESMPKGILPSTKINQSLQIETQNGLIQGMERKSINGQVYFSYVGIPYARPPINELRFKSPKPMPKWSGILDATVKGPCCAGINISLLNKAEYSFEGEEDCLYLHVYTPRAASEATAKNPLSVMVYIYGGAFFTGCADLYGPDYFIENNVVLVIPNYRVSIFGYLSTEDIECPGNWASKDQIAALKWVQANIRKFGGDPTKVTIFGQSAGAVNVNVLLLSPKARGLFHRAIMMSGSSLSYWAYQKQPRKIAFDVGVALGIETNSSKILIDELRKIDTYSLMQGQVAPVLMNFLMVWMNGLPVTPSVEPVHQKAVLTDYPYTLLEKGEFNHVPVMIGVTSAEGALFRSVLRQMKPILFLLNLSPGLMVRMTTNRINKNIVAQKILTRFLNTTDLMKANNEEGLLHIFSEEGFLRPSRKMASLIAKYSPVYFYEFSYEGQLGIELIRNFLGLPTNTQRASRGVLHSEDVAYLFTTEIVDLESYKKYMNMSKKLSKIYTNFAKTGNPTPFRDPLLDNVTWPRITTEKFPYMNLGQYFTEVWDNFNEENFQFWEHLFNKYGEKPYKVY